MQEDSAKLQAAYAGEKAMEITNKEFEVVNAWRNLQQKCEARRMKLADTGDLFKFFMMVRTLKLWMDDIVRQMNTTEKPRFLIHDLSVQYNPTDSLRTWPFHWL